MSPSFEDHAVFIVGQAKAGTTLVTSLLDGHPQLAVIPVETDYYTTLWERIRYIHWMWRLNPEQQAELILDTITQYSHFRHPPEGFDYDAFKMRLKVMIGRLGAIVSRRDLPDLFALAIRGKANKKLWIEKTPHHINHLPEITEDFPKARFIFVYRDPRDNYTSYRRKHQNQNAELPVELFAERWNLRFRQIEEIKNSKQVFYFKTEDLLQNPEMKMRELAAFLEIEFNETLLKPTLCSLPWTGNSMWGDSNTEISPSIIGRYREKLEPDEILCLESVCDTEMKACGYDFTTTEADRKTFLKTYRTPAGIEIKAKSGWKAMFQPAYTMIKGKP